MAQKFVSRIFIHGTIGNIVFKADVRIKLSDFNQGENGNNAVMPLCLSLAEINGEVVRAIRRGGHEQCISVEPLLPVAVPSPGSIRVGIASWALTVENTLGLAVAYLDAVMTGTRIIGCTVIGNRKVFRVTQEAHFEGSIDNTAGQEFLKDYLSAVFGEFILDCKRGKLFYNTVVFGEDIFFAGLKLFSGLSVETAKLFLPGNMYFMGCLPKAFGQIIIRAERRCFTELEAADGTKQSITSDLGSPLGDIMFTLVKHKDKRPNNTLLVLCGTAGIRIKWFDDRVKIIEVEQVEF
jgi:hypothetical protein